MLIAGATYQGQEYCGSSNNGECDLERLGDEAGEEGNDLLESERQSLWAQFQYGM